MGVCFLAFHSKETAGSGQMCAMIMQEENISCLMLQLIYMAIVVKIMIGKLGFNYKTLALSVTKLQ